MRFLIALIVGLLLGIFAADAEACGRCGLFGNRCRFSSHVQHVAHAPYIPPVTSQNFIFNNAFPPYLLSQGGQSIYGVQSLAGAYADSPALFMDRAARFTELALQQSGDATAAFNETGRLALELNDAADRRAKNFALALSAMESSGPVNQQLHVEVINGKAQIVQQQQAPPPEPFTLQQLTSGAACATCHTADAAADHKGVVLDGSQPFDLGRASEAVMLGRMPPKHNLTAEQKRAVVNGLCELLHRQPPQPGDLQ